MRTQSSSEGLATLAKSIPVGWDFAVLLSLQAICQFTWVLLFDTSSSLLPVDRSWAGDPASFSQCF